jgi:hypothetical protein
MTTEKGIIVKFAWKEIAPDQLTQIKNIIGGITTR